MSQRLDLAISVIDRKKDDASIQSNIEEDGEDDVANWEIVDALDMDAFGFVARISIGFLQFHVYRRMYDTSNLSSHECVSQKDNVEEMLDRITMGNIQKEEMATNS